MAGVKKNILNKALSKEIVKSVKDLGFDIDIEHTRAMVCRAAYNDPNTQESIFDSFLTREEYAKYLNENKLLTYDDHIIRKPFYGCYVKPTGGFTRVIIQLNDENKTVVIGKHNFNKGNFEKSVGIFNAVRNALSKINIRVDVDTKEDYPTISLKEKVNV